MKLRKWFLCALAFCLLSGSLPGLSEAALAYAPVDTDREASLDIYFGADGKGFAGTEFRLYRVVEISETAEFTLTGAFSSCPVGLEGLDGDGWKTLAETLSGYAAVEEIEPDRTARTGQDGYAGFDKLKTGLYLAEGDTAARGGRVYVPGAFLVSLPGLGEESGSCEYAVQAGCKHESRPEGTVLSQKVLKVWKDKGHEDSRPKEITVHLLKNGKTVDIVKLNSGNGWKHTWTGLDGDARWQVAEVRPSGDYTVSVEQEGTAFVVTNTRKTEKTDTPGGKKPSAGGGKGRLLQTGVLRWPVPLLAGAGLMLFLLGYKKYKTQEDRGAAEGLGQTAGDEKIS